MANQTDTALTRLVDDLRAAHGDNLTSIVLYGSVAAGDQVGRHSDHNLLIVLKRINVDDLRRSQTSVREWLSLKQPAPVFFTEEELKDGADVFPIEFLQMEQARKILHGRDPFEFVEISHANLRHQTEYELRTKLIQLRRLYLSTAASENLCGLIRDSFASFAALFRAVLILHGKEAPVSKAESVRATVRLLALDGSPFEKVIELRADRDSTLNGREATDLFAAYLEQIERVIEAVDQLAS